jgi:hypothetical protein
MATENLHVVSINNTYCSRDASNRVTRDGRKRLLLHANAQVCSNRRLHLNGNFYHT